MKKSHARAPGSHKEGVSQASSRQAGRQGANRHQGKGSKAWAASKNRHKMSKILNNTEKHH
jgi:hypothetical protein